MKHYLLILTWSLIPLFAYSQDILITREGEVIEAFNLFEKDNSSFIHIPSVRTARFIALIRASF